MESMKHSGQSQGVPTHSLLEKKVLLEKMMVEDAEIHHRIMQICGSTWAARFNVFIIGLDIEPKKLPVHSSLVEPMAEFRYNWWCQKYNLFLFKIKNNFKYLKYI